MPNDMGSLQIPEHYLLPSNLYSEQEIILISWLERLGSADNSCSRIINLESDLKNGLVISNILKSYVKSSKLDSILQLRKSCPSDEDLRFNQSRILSSLHELNLQSPLTPEDLINPLSQDILLFCLILYFSLPHYQPVREQIVFECVLGEVS